MTVESGITRGKGVVRRRMVGVDIGGTRMRAAVLDADCRLLERAEIPTRAHESPETVVPRLLDLIESIMPGKDGPPIAAIGISSVGPVDPVAGVVLSPPNVPGLRNVPLVDVLHTRFHIPTFLVKDTNAAVLGEVTHGAAQGHKHAIFITISTGIGGGVVIDGQLFEGAMGMAGEIGHMTIPMEDGRVSNLELEAAGPALAEQAVARIQAGETSQIFALVKGDLNAVSGKTVGQAALAGDSLAIELIERTGHLVGIAIVSLMHLFNPTIFVIGGGVTAVGDLLFDKIRETVRQHALNRRYWEDVPIIPAALGDDVGLIGAATLALRRLAQQ